MNPDKYCTKCYTGHPNKEDKCLTCSTPLKPYRFISFLKWCKQRYKTGKKFNYPTCCIFHFLFYSFLSFVGIKFTKKIYCTNPTVKCLYHRRNSKLFVKREHY